MTLLAAIISITLYYRGRVDASLIWVQIAGWWCLIEMFAWLFILLLLQVP